MDTQIDTKYLDKVKEKYIKTLTSVLNRNLETVYLKENNISDLVKDYCKDSIDIVKFIYNFRNIPLTTYKDYEPFINRIYNQGESNVLAKGYPIWFAKSGGATGSPKTFPIFLAPEMLELLKFPNKKVIELIKKHTNYSINSQSKGLSLIWKTPKGYSPYNNVPVGFASSLIQIPNVDFEPKAIKYIVNHNDHLKISLLFNLLEENLEYIHTPFINTIVDFFSILENKLHLLCNCLKENRFFLKSDLESDIGNDVFNYLEEEYSKILKTKHSRIEELLNILTVNKSHKDFSEIAMKIWPRLKIISAIYSSITLEQHLQLAKYYTSSKPLYVNCGYGCSEGFIGAPVFFHSTGYRIIDHVYPEFIPYNLNKDAYESGSESGSGYGSGHESQDVKSVWDVETNKTYEIVVTNSNGYCRYKIGDVVRVVGWLEHSPVIKFIKRKGWSLAVGGYRIEDEYVKKGIENTELPIKDWVAFNNIFEQPAGFGFFAELDSDYYSLGSDSNIVNIKENKIRKAEEQINKYFSEVNEFYKEAIEEQKINKSIIKIVPRNSFNKYLERIASSSNSSNSRQMEIPVTITDVDSVEFFNDISSNVRMSE